MKKMFKHQRMPMRAPEGVEGGAGAGSGEPQGGGSQTPSAGNNTTDNSESFATLWEQPKVETQTQQQSVGGFQQQSQQQSHQSPEDVWTAHLSQIGLGPLEIPESLTETLGEEGVRVLKQQHDASVSAYKNAMVGMKQFVQTELQKQQEQNTQNSQNVFTIETLRSKMNQELPFTKNPAIKPIAETVARKFIEQGKPMDEVVSQVKSFFAYIADQTGEFVMPNQNQSSRFGGNSKQKTNWEEFFSEL